MSSTQSDSDVGEGLLLRACFRHEAVDHLVWFDSDVVIANYTLAMETILRRPPPNRARSCWERWRELGCPFNTGHALAPPNTTDRVLRRWRNCTTTPRAHAINPEQMALTRMYKSYMWVRQLCVVPRRPLLQSFMKFEEQQGDFSLHFTPATQ